MNTQNSTTADAYLYCEELTRRRESNFALGFQFLPEPQRKAIHVIYAVCRYLDDVSDEMKGADIPGLLRIWKKAIDEVYDKKRSSHPIGVALADVLKTFDIPRDGFYDLIEGCQQDQRKKAYTTFGDLEGYCDLVATSIAKVSLPIYGCPDLGKAFGASRALSIAFQLTNILRDVSEDYPNKRVYLPKDELERFRLKPSDFMARQPAERIIKFFRFQAERCDQYFKKGYRVLQYLDEESHPCVTVMALTYHTLLEKIIQDPLRALKVQTSLSSEEKKNITERRLDPL